MASEAQDSRNRVPRVRVEQDESSKPVRVVMVDDKKEPSLGLFALMIFGATLLASLIGLAADSGELLGSLEEFDRVLNPPAQVCVAGSTTVLAGGTTMGQQWATAFEKEHGGAINVQIEAVGSTAGIDMAVNGDCVDVLAMSEPMTERQFNTLNGAGIEIACAAEIGFDAISFVASATNPMVEAQGDDPGSVRTVSVEEVRGILTGEIRTWGELANWPLDARNQPFTIWIREGSGTTEVILQRFLGFVPTADQPFPPAVNYAICDSPLDCLNRTAELPGSLYWTSVAALDEGALTYLRPLIVVAPTTNIARLLNNEPLLSDYPAELVRPLYMYVLDTRRNDAASLTNAETWLRYVRGISGQAILDENGFYNHFGRPFGFSVPFPAALAMTFGVRDQGFRTVCRGDQVGG